MKVFFTFKFVCLFIYLSSPGEGKQKAKKKMSFLLRQSIASVRRTTENNCFSGCTLHLSMGDWSTRHLSPSALRQAASSQPIYLYSALIHCQKPYKNVARTGLQSTTASSRPAPQRPLSRPPPTPCPGVPEPRQTVPMAGSPPRPPQFRARGPAEGSPGESSSDGRDRARGRLRARPRTAGCRPLPSAPARPRGVAGGARAAARRGGRGSKSPSRARRRGSGCQQRRGSDSSEPEAARIARRGAGDAAAEGSAAGGFYLRLAARSFLQRRPRGCGTATLRHPPSLGAGRQEAARGSLPAAPPPRPAPAARAAPGAAGAGGGCPRYATPLLPRPGLRCEWEARARRRRLSGGRRRPLLSVPGRCGTAARGARGGGPGAAGARRVVPPPLPAPPSDPFRRAAAERQPRARRGHGGRGTCLCGDPPGPRGAAPARPLSVGGRWARLAPRPGSFGARAALRRRRLFIAPKIGQE